MFDTKRLVLDFRDRKLTEVMTNVARNNQIFPRQDVVDAVFDDDESEDRSQENKWDGILVPGENVQPVSMAILARERDYRLLPDRAVVLLREFPQEDLGYEGIVVPRYNRHYFYLTKGKLWALSSSVIVFRPNHKCAWAFFEPDPPTNAA